MESLDYLGGHPITVNSFEAKVDMSCAHYSSHMNLASHCLLLYMHRFCQAAITLSWLPIEILTFPTSILLILVVRPLKLSSQNRTSLTLFLKPFDSQVIITETLVCDTFVATLRTRKLTHQFARFVLSLFAQAIEH